MTQCSRTESLDGPRVACLIGIRGPAIAESIMQSGLAALPELDLGGQHPEAAPVRRAGDLDASEPFLDLAVPTLEHRTIGDDLALPRSPCPDL